VGRVITWLVAVGAAGCTALSGVGDLSVGSVVEVDASAPEAGTPADANVNGGDAGVLPEADAEAEAGVDAGSRDADAATPDADARGPDPTHPTSCKALRDTTKDSASRVVLIDPDGSGPQPPFSVYCDMTTAGGGWTVVFTSLGNQSSSVLDYTSATSALLTASSETLLVYRRDDRVIVGATAVLSLPAAWKLQSPFKAKSVDLITQVSIDGATQTRGTLRFGYGDFGDSCDADWLTDDVYGRVCIAGTTAPFYSAFASGSVDLCPDSSQKFDAIGCSDDRRFTIAVR